MALTRLFRSGLFGLATLCFIGCGMNRSKLPTEINLTSSFSSINQNILSPICSNCHGTRVTNYMGLLNSGWVEPGSPGNSRLYQAVESQRMPKGGAPLNDAQLSAIYEWIQSGARNN